MLSGTEPTTTTAVFTKVIVRETHLKHIDFFAGLLTEHKHTSQAESRAHVAGQFQVAYRFAVHPHLDVLVVHWPRDAMPAAETQKNTRRLCLLCNGNSRLIDIESIT